MRALAWVLLGAALAGICLGGLWAWSDRHQRATATELDRARGDAVATRDAVEGELARARGTLGELAERAERDRITIEQLTGSLDRSERERTALADATRRAGQLALDLAEEAGGDAASLAAIERAALSIRTIAAGASSP